MRQRKPSDDVSARLDALGQRLSELENRTASFRKELRAHGRDLARIGPQVAALEQRVESLRQHSEQQMPAADGEREQARSLLELVRREHEQVRIRVFAAARYEERLSRLEDELAALPVTGGQAPKN
ncbi:MAG: hypothetical protein ACR2JT_02460 [Nocardioidaceae bacterium]